MHIIQSLHKTPSTPDYFRCFAGKGNFVFYALARSSRFAVLEKISTLAALRVVFFPKTLPG